MATKGGSSKSGGGGGGGSRTVYRDSDSGQFVDKGYVKGHPRTTETEHRPAKKK